VSIESTGAACFWLLLCGLLLFGSSFTGPKVFWVRYVEREGETPFVEVTSHIILGWLFNSLSTSLTEYEPRTLSRLTISKIHEPSAGQLRLQQKAGGWSYPEMELGKVHKET
jgi:hypothetical protein